MKLKFGLIGILIFVLIFASCSKKNETQTHTADTEENFSAGFDPSAMLGGDLWFTAAGTEIKVTIAAQEILNQFENYFTYIDENAPLEPKIIFTSTNAVDLEFLAIRIEYNETKGEFFLIEEASLASSIIRPDTPFVVNWLGAGSFPHRAVAFYDRNEIKRYFAISGNDSGEGAPVILSEYKAGVDVYANILNGDFSESAGIWSNAYTRNRLYADGIFLNSDTVSIASITTGDFNKNNGAYFWSLYDDGRLSYEIGLFPAGVQLRLEQNLIVTDNAKPRILIYQFDGPISNDDVFYMEGEAFPRVN